MELIWYPLICSRRRRLELSAWGCCIVLLPFDLRWADGSASIREDLVPYRCSVLGGKGCENQGVWPDASSASLASLPLRLLPLTFLENVSLLSFLCVPAWSFIKRKGTVDGEEEVVEKLHYGGCCLWNLALIVLDLLACFAVNEKKPEGDVPSKHSNDCLEYGFLN